MIIDTINQTENCVLSLGCKHSVGHDIPCQENIKSHVNNIGLKKKIVDAHVDKSVGVIKVTHAQSHTLD